MLAIHPQARTTPAARAEIARSPESSVVLAKRYGVSTETFPQKSIENSFWIAEHLQSQV